MPGILNQAGSTQLCNAPAAATGAAVAVGSCGGIWTRRRDVITFEQLQKFWSELSPRARQELLRIDKQTLFEQARKNLYCSRCNGLLLEGFSQIVMYGKSLQQEGDVGVLHSNRIGASEIQNDEEANDVQDPSVHPWGGLAATRDGILTLLDCFISAKSLKPVQNVFDSARARERERELLYPDACGGGGRGWISQGMANYGRCHGTRETCALHTARLSCDTLVDFWSALSDETRLSLLRMKEEDFIERLMYRFDSKRFCRDCRRNVIREFKELKELKRMRKETRCTSWFCVADTAFQYELSEDTVQADWHQSFIDTAASYHHFEWAIGTGEGKSDILDFEDVGMNANVQVNGLDLGCLSSCFITLRAWRLDGRCTELSVKAHALKGQSCVHRRLVVGDGFVTITKGEGIKRFFEHAEEAEEEEDDDAMDKDGSDIDGDGSRPQKHAKSPELAREFLLDAATVIFKEQVEKAFREGTARQNAHSIFVCLALKLLEERVHVACKEIITLEKQFKLLEEEEREKREEEERKERRRTREREKKLRRKERIRGKERERERKQAESHSLHFDTQTSVNDSPTSTHDESPNSHDSGDSVSDPGDNIMPAKPMYTVINSEQSSNGCVNTEGAMNDTLQHQCHVVGELNPRDCNGSFTLEQSKLRRKMRFKNDYPPEEASKWYDKRQSIISNEGSLQHDEYEGHRTLRGNVVKNSARSCGSKFNERFHSSNSRLRTDFHSCACNQNVDYRKDVNRACAIRTCKEMKVTNKKESFDMQRPLYRSSNGVVQKGKLIGGPSFHMKQVWEPMDARKKCTRSNSDPDISLRTASKIDPSRQGRTESDEAKCRQQCNLPSDDHCTPKLSEDLMKVGSLGSHEIHDDQSKRTLEGSRKSSSKYSAMTKSDCLLKNGAVEEVGSCPTISKITASNGCDPMMSSSSSDNCSSCLSEGDSSTSSSSARNAESSSTSDSEDASPQSDGRVISTCNRNSIHIFHDDSSDSKHKTIEEGAFTSRTSTGSLAGCIGDSSPREESARVVQTYDNVTFEFGMARQQQHMLPMHNQRMHVPIFSSPHMGYHDQSAVAWSAAPANGFMPFPQQNHYVFPSTIGYGPTVNQPSDYCMQFSTIQPHLVFNVQQHPMYQTNNRVIVASSKEQTLNPKVSTAQHVNGGAVEAMGPPLSSKQLSSKPSAIGQNACFENSDRSHTDSSSFSLFHFGGPVAGAAGCNVNSVSLDGIAGGLTSTSSQVQGNLARLKKEMEIEEYSLFATNNGSRFSFF